MACCAEVLRAVLVLVSVFFFFFSASGKVLSTWNIWRCVAAFHSRWVIIMTGAAAAFLIVLQR